MTTDKHDPGNASCCWDGTTECPLRDMEENQPNEWLEAHPVVPVSFWNPSPALMCPAPCQGTSPGSPGCRASHFTALTDGQSSACWHALLLPGLWALTSHNLSSWFSFIGLDIDVNFPAKRWKAAWVQMTRPEASPPRKAKENTHSFAESSQETQSPFCPPSRWQKVVSVFGERELLGCCLSALHWMRSCLCPQLVPVLACTSYSRGEQNNVSTSDSFLLE